MSDRIRSAPTRVRAAALNDEVPQGSEQSFVLV